MLPWKVNIISVKRLLEHPVHVLKLCGFCDMNFDTEALLSEQLSDWTAKCRTKMWDVLGGVNVAWLSGDVRTIDSGLLCERSVRSMHLPCGNTASAAGGLASLSAKA